MKLPKLFKGQTVGGINAQAILVGLAIMALIVVMVIAFGLLFLANVDAQLVQIGQDQGLNVTSARAVIATGVTTLAGIPVWLGLVVLAFVLLVILAAIAAVAMVAWRMQGGTGQ